MTYIELNLQTYNKSYIKKQISPMYTACNKHLFTPTHLGVNVHTCTEFMINAVISINFCSFYTFKVESYF